MDPQIVQRTRYVLRSRVRRTQTCPQALFQSACQQFVDWLEGHPVFKALIQVLSQQGGTAVGQLDRTLADCKNMPSAGYYDPGFYSATTTVEHAAVCWKVLKAVASTTDLEEVHRSFLLRTLSEYLTRSDEFDLDKSIEVLRDVAIDGLYEYLDEQLDTRNIIYSVLLKYKQRSEWFHRLRLREIADIGLEGKLGERALAIDLQDYVFDQQIEFTIEPVSSSGEADLVLRDPEGRYLILDAKYVPQDASRSVIVDKLANGFHQVYRYCEDYNEPEGFLVCFFRSSKRIAAEMEQVDGLSFVKIGARNVYYLPIHISDEPSASKGGKAEEIIIARPELIRAVLDSENERDPS